MRMRLYNSIAILVTLLTITVTSCREKSDDLDCYAYNDVLNFVEANASLEGQFKAIWTAMNCNYPIWDYEEEHGVDWDAVYEKYAPQFRELDRKYNGQNPVPDDALTSLYNEIFQPLHDGHLFLYLRNIHTGKKIEHSISPSIQKRLDAIKNSTEDALTEILVLLFQPSLEYYVGIGEVVECKEENNYIYGRFNDGIVYFRLPSFNLLQTFASKANNEQNEKIYQVWEAWFNAVQKLHEDGNLKGVVIDLRNNSGGNIYDYQYILGALQAGDFYSGGTWFRQIGYLREKSGIGRLDYSVLQKFVMPVYQYSHACIDAPVVILANNYSASASEIICIAAKQMKNGYVIGTQTYGAFSPSADASYAISYAGNVGDPALAGSQEASSYFAPFFIDLPSSAFLSLEKKVIEGVGIDPNEYVIMDWTKISATKQDTQLDRALEFIRNRK